jgi:hypothetical protein
MALIHANEHFSINLGIRVNSRQFADARNTFGARNLAGVAGHARRSKKKTTKERKVADL